MRDHGVNGIAAWGLVFLALGSAPLPAQTNGNGPAAAAPDSVALGEATVTAAAGTDAHRLRAPTLPAVRRGGPIALDGRLDEAVWAGAPAATAFRQREPNEGEPATQRTEVRFLYDEHNLYIGARMYDEGGGEAVVSRLVRRDSDPQSDELTITLDTFHDHLGRTQISINPAGVRGDAFGPGGAWPDQSWDPVWQAATHVDSLGWSAELRIPFSQLRFPDTPVQDWGLQIERFVHHLNEVQVWSFWRLNDSGGPTRYGHLTGVEVPGTGRLEVLPYAVAQTETRGTVDAANPFDSETETGLRTGADLKYLLTSNLTLNATINPDFGQAEVDPAVVNLSAFETFFPEKREFFIEGRGLFDFGGFNCFFCSNVSGLSMLFTRRIGRSPQGAGLAHDAGEFAAVPENTTIAGAAKITGRTAGGYSLGILNAVTTREHARIMGGDGRPFAKEVEPLTNYFAGRVKRDLEDGDVQVGGIFTSVMRELGDPDLSGMLSSHAEGLGFDGDIWWGDRTYRWMGRVAFTNVAGSPEAILRRQESSARYFQRPDRDHGSNGLFTDRYDPTLTSMRGFGAYSRVAKESGDWRWESALNVRSPGFENNDIAFLTRTDFIWMNANVNRQFTTPTSWYRRLDFTAGVQQQYNFDGDLTDRQLQFWAGTQTPFYWWMNGFLIYRPRADDDRLTRGGPVVRRPESWFAHFWLATDDRKPVVMYVNPSMGWNEEGSRSPSIGVGLTFKPASNVSLSLEPRLSRSESSAQYVTAVDDPTAGTFFGRRYVFADLEQKTLSMNTRLNVTFTPDMTFELFAQPFISSSDFTRFKEFDAPRRLAKSVYGTDRGTIAMQDDDGEREYTVDPDGAGPARSFSFPDPDFTFRSLRVNAIFRWEYQPGSTLFLVWTQDRSSTLDAGELDFGRDRAALFQAPADNILLLKLSYWLGL